MKTIDEAVNELSQERLKEIARGHFRRNVNCLRGTLHEINYRAQLRDNPDADGSYKVFINNYNIWRAVLKADGMFDPKYDEYFEKAKKGELNGEELNPITQ